MSIAGALATLLDVVDRDSKARCARILADAQEQVAALRAEAMREGRQRLRAALRAERADTSARMAAARAQLETDQRRAQQRRAGLALDAAEALLPDALQAVWANPAQRRQWLEQTLAQAARSLPRDAWRIRHPLDLGDADRAWLRQRLDELGAASASFEADAGIAAGIEIQAGAARLEATPAGLLADRAWVYGRLLQLLEGAPAGPSQGGAANPPEPQSGEPPSPPALGRRQGFAEHCSALPQPAGYAEPAVGRGWGEGSPMSKARIEWISGPVLRARATGPFALREALRVGPDRLLGEVVSLHEDHLVAQVYEDTTGLRPGDAVEGSGLPLSIRLGPGLLGGIFDGLLRPLAGSDSVFVAPGMGGESARRHAFRPTVQAGQTLQSGAEFGRVAGPSAAAREHRCLVPPGTGGEVLRIAAAGEHADDDVLCVLRDAEGREHELALSEVWPVRVPRPVAQRLPSGDPLVTGQRVIDALFPVALGGKAAIPGGFGTGKTVLLEALVKACAADVIVYLGCGERGNEMAGAVEEIAGLIDARSGRPMSERTVIVANTSNMPVAAREASIYCAVTIAEYFRDQGLHVALMADSTSRWAEALREVSGRLGELPGEGGYPAYLGSRLAEFYERAARVRTLGGDLGSVTLIGSVSPQSGDFSEPVTSHTTRYVRSFWALDVTRARARFYPAIAPLASYSQDAETVAAWWTGVFAETFGAAENDAATGWQALRRRFLTLLAEQARLERMARIVGKDALQPQQRLTLLCAEVVNEAFLRQSAYSSKDAYCGPQRQARMMRLLARFMDRAEAALARGSSPEAVAALPVLRPLQRMGDEIGEDEAEAFVALEAALEAEFAALGKEAGDAA